MAIIAIETTETSWLHYNKNVVHVEKDNQQQGGRTHNGCAVGRPEEQG